MQRNKAICLYGEEAENGTKISWVGVSCLNCSLTSCNLLCSNMLE